VADLTSLDGFLRHIEACNNAKLPGVRRAFCIRDAQVGWVQPVLADALAGFPDIHAEPTRVILTAPAALPVIARTLSERGFYRWRNEAFDVRAMPKGPVLSTIDRSALPSFGVTAAGVHVNGLVWRADGLFLWIARRAWNKALDPGKLDHLVAGGVPAGLTPEQTLVKEAAEEAAVPSEIAATAQRVGVISYAMERSEGLRRDRLTCYDLFLPAAFQPRAEDGEVDSFELWPVERVVEAVRNTDDFKFNVTLVLIDLFLRHGLIKGPAVTHLRAALDNGHV
jgi:8-oxo-dGTP pyrophosphatase MutT (NUDIX family)